MPEGLQPEGAAGFGIVPTTTSDGFRESMRHTGQGVGEVARPVVYRLPAASPVSPSIACGVVISVVKLALPGSSSANAGKATAAALSAAMTACFMAPPPRGEA